MKRAVNKVKGYISKYERHISSAALLGGFILDSLTLQRIDFLFENIVISSYLVIAGLGIIFLTLYEGGKIKGRFFDWLHKYMPIGIQFAFGGLFSAFLVFYFRSASLAAAWPFVLLLVGLFIGNELFKRYYERTIFNIAVYFFCIFLFSIYFIPVLLRRIGDDIFLLSGGLSLIVISLFIVVLYFLVPVIIRNIKFKLIYSIAGIFVFIAILYFTNIIPPIPLALKDIGVYHTVTRVQGGYEVKDEYSERNIWSFLKDKTPHVVPGQRLYVYSAVFAPTSLNTEIVHVWQQYDVTKKSWVTVTRSPFSITGGRDRGYRGYSWKSSITPGKWRVNVENARGQLIGRVSFNVESASEAPLLQTEVLK